MSSRGLHHITTIIADARRTRHFYADVLGLRLIKKTVCYDDPGSYHLYYGDGLGQPGTVMSALTWNCVSPGMIGVGEVVQTALRVPVESLDWWRERLTQAGVSSTFDHSAFGERTLCFCDPDGTTLALVGARETKPEGPWWASRVGLGNAVRGLHSVTLSLREADATIDILQDIFGFHCVSQREGWMRFVAHDEPGGTLDLHLIGRSSRGRLGGGTIRHVAFRAADVNEQCAMAERLQRVYGITVSEPIERTYLQAVAFRAPCGVLFEIATDGPGFTADEASEQLGEALKLPVFLEERRHELEGILPPLG